MGSMLRSKEAAVKMLARLYVLLELGFLQN